jgi:hypothetical protein
LAWVPSVARQCNGKHPESGYRANGMFGVRQHGRSPGRRGRRQHGSGPRRKGFACQLRLSCGGSARAWARRRGAVGRAACDPGVSLTGVGQPGRSARRDRDFPSGDAQPGKLEIPPVNALHRLLHVSGLTAGHGPRPHPGPGKSRWGQPSILAPRTAACTVKRCSGDVGS